MDAFLTLLGGLIGLARIIFDAFVGLPIWAQIAVAAVLVVIALVVGLKLRIAYVRTRYLLGIDRRPYY